MGSFASGFLGGFTEEATKKKKDGSSGGPLSKIRIRNRGSRVVSKPGMKGTIPYSGTRERGEDYIPGFKRGGRVRKTGIAKVHKGERVLTKRQAKRYRRSRSKGR